MAVRPPPAAPELDPLIEVWAAGQHIVRVHSVRRAAAAFNPGRSGRGRFHPIVTDDGAVVPWLYGAEDDEGAICESVFHDVPFGAGARVSEASLAQQAISTIKPLRPLRLALLAGLGLRRIGVSRDELIEPLGPAYTETARWAESLHDCPAEPDGLLWRARSNDQSLSLTLFGDRVAEEDLEVVEHPVPLVLGEGYERVLRVATRAGIVLVPTS